MGSLFVQLLLIFLIGVCMDTAFCAITHIQQDEETQKKSVDVNLDDDFINYGRSHAGRHRVTVNSSIDDSIFVEVQLKGGINITVIEDNNNNVTTRVIAEETNVMRKKHNLQDSPNELEDITNKVNELISSNNLSLEDTIKELKFSQEYVQKLLAINTSPHNIEQLEYLLIILKASIGEKSKENENIARLSKLIDLVMEQLENPLFKISKSDALVSIVKDIENLVKTVRSTGIREKVDAVLYKFYDLNKKRSVQITDNNKVDRLMELKELLDTENFTTMKLNELENIYDEILELQKHLRNSNYSSLVNKLENEALMLFHNIKLFDDIDRRMIADVDQIDLKDLNNLEKSLLELLRKINNPIAIENAQSKLKEMRDTLKTHYDMENNVEPYIALNYIEFILNNTVVVGGNKTLIDIQFELSQYLKTATNEEQKNQAIKLVIKTKQLIDDLEIAKKIIDEVEQSLNQTYDEKTVRILIGHKSFLIEIMNTIKDQQMVITAKKMLFDIQKIVKQFNTEQQIMNIKRAASEIDETLDVEIVEKPIEIYRRIERIENEAKEISKFNMSPNKKQEVDGILDESRRLKSKLSEATSELFKSMENLSKLINTLKTKNLPTMRINYEKVVEKFERFNDTIRNEAIDGLEERLDMVHTDYYRIEKSLENIQQNLSSFNFRRTQLSSTYPFPVDQKKADEILSKLGGAVNQPNVTENIKTTRKVLLDMEHAEETLNQAKNILEFLNHLNKNKLIDEINVPEEEKELNALQIMEDENTDDSKSRVIKNVDVSEKELEASLGNETTEDKIQETDVRKINATESFSLLSGLNTTNKNITNVVDKNIILLGDETTAENVIITDFPVDQVTENIMTDVHLNIKTESDETTSKNIITDAPIEITTESDDHVTENINTDAIKITKESENTISNVPIENTTTTESEDRITKNKITDIPVNTTIKSDDTTTENIYHFDVFKDISASRDPTNKNIFIAKQMENLTKNEETVRENAKTLEIMEITTASSMIEDEYTDESNSIVTENLVIEKELQTSAINESTEHTLQTTDKQKLNTNESFSNTTDKSVSNGDDKKSKTNYDVEIAIEISPSIEDQVKENITKDPLEEITTEKEYSAIMKVSSLKAKIEKKLDELKMKMTNPKFSDLEELQNCIAKTLELPPSADKEKLLIEFLKIKADIEQRILNGNPLKRSSISDEDLLNEDHAKSIKNKDSFEMKKPIKEMNNDLMKITDIEKSAKNYSATVNSNIIVNLKSIKSTFFDSSLLENNVRSLLEDSINVNETLARIDVTRTYLDTIRPEVDDNQQWMLEQLESYLFNVELDSLTSKLIADIKTLLSNYNS